jgi:hypothetical protein
MKNLEFFWLQTAPAQLTRAPDLSQGNLDPHAYQDSGEPQVLNFIKIYPK